MEDFLKLVIFNPSLAVQTYPPKFLFCSSSLLGTKKVSRIGNLSMTLRKESPGLAIFELKIKGKCGYPSLNIDYLGCDEFTNEMIIGAILTRLDIPTIKYYTSTVCKKECLKPTDFGCVREGIHFIEEAMPLAKINLTEKIKVLDTLSWKNEYFVIEGITKQALGNIISQVVILLDYLQEFYFNHGNLGLSSLYYIDEEIDIDYRGIEFTSPFTVKLGNFNKSSLTLEGKKGPLRIYNRSWLADRYLYIAPFDPLISQDDITEKEPFFILDELFNASTFNRSQHMGLLFYLAFDTYSFFISLLTLPKFYYPFFEYYNDLWEILWFESPRVKERVYKNIGKELTLEDIINTLKGIRLRCDVTTRIINFFVENEVF